VDEALQLNLEVMNAVAVQVALDNGSIIRGSSLVFIVPSERASLVVERGILLRQEMEGSIALRRAIRIYRRDVDLIDAFLEVGDDVAVRAGPGFRRCFEDKRIRADATGHDVLSGTTNDDVRAGAAVQLVRAGPAIENVAAAIAGQHVVVAGASHVFDADELVTGGIPARCGPSRQVDVDRAGAPIAGRIVSVAAIDDVPAGAAVHFVRASPAIEHVAAAIAAQHVVVAGASQVFDADELVTGGLPARCGPSRQVDIDRGGARVAVRVVATAAVEHVRAGAALQHVTTAETLEGFVAAVGLAGVWHDVVAVGADEFLRRRGWRSRLCRRGWRSRIRRRSGRSRCRGGARFIGTDIDSSNDASVAVQIVRGDAVRAGSVIDRQRAGAEVEVIARCPQEFRIDPELVAVRRARHRVAAVGLDRCLAGRAVVGDVVGPDDVVVAPPIDVLSIAVLFLFTDGSATAMLLTQVLLFDAELLSSPRQVPVFAGS